MRLETDGYSVLDGTVDETGGLDKHRTWVGRKFSSSHGAALCAVNILLAISLLCGNFFVWSRAATAATYDSDSELFQGQYSREVEFRWTGNYTPSTPAEASRADELWNAFDPTFGIVALSRDDARAAGVPETRPLVSDPTKGVFMIQAYHLMHCVVSTESHLL